MKDLMRNTILFLIAVGIICGLTACGKKEEALQDTVQESVEESTQELVQEPAADSLQESVQSGEMVKNEPSPIEEIADVEEESSRENESDVEIEEDVEAFSELRSESDVDVDLSVLSSTMVYAEVFAMMNEPEKYLEKTIRIKGQYTTEYWEETEQSYYYVIISDALACCQSGIEFILEDGLEYPKQEEEIEVTGVFRSYQEFEQTYYYLDVNTIKTL